MSLSLRRKLALGFALVAAVPLAVMQQAVSATVRREFESRTEEQFDTLRHVLEAQFLREGERIERATRALAEQDDNRLFGPLQAYLSEGASRQAELIAAIEAASAEARLPLLTLYRADGTVIASAQEPQRFDEIDGGIAGMPRGGPVLDRQEGLDVRGLALRIAVPVDETLLLVGGVLLAGEFLAQLPVERSLALVVKSADGVLHAPTEAGRDVAAQLTAGDYEAALAALGEAGWSVRQLKLPEIETRAPVQLLFAVSRAPMEASLAKLQRTFVALLVGGLALAVALAFAISRHWTRPFEQLVRGFERVAQGDLGARVGLQGDDELGRLGHAFDAMTTDLSESRDLLLRAERIAAWRDIARRLAHEIKNPLSPIALSMETLRRSYASGRADFPELLDECTTTVLEEVERLRVIVQEFSDFARLPKPMLIEGSMHDVIRGVIALHAGLGDRYRFVTDFEEGPGEVRFDADQMNRLLVNLVKNAIEAMPEGGEVRIETRTDRARGWFMATVTDQGPGVPAELAEDLFRPYQTSKVGGTGLGLAIAHRIASEHGGTLRLLNPGQPGACFRVELRC